LKPIAFAHNNQKTKRPDKPMKNIKQKLGLAAALLAASLAVATADPVVFNVNMSVQAALGNFSAGNGDGVRVLGLNGDWATGVTLVPSVANTNIYTVTNDLAVSGAWPNYKFVITPASGPWVWESPADFGGGNRYFSVPAGGTNLPVVYFSDNTNLPSYTVYVTFQVDMAVAIQQGKFTMDSDYVDVFGGFNNWSQTGVLLTNVPGTSNYVAVLTTTSLSTNTDYTYKFAINGYGGSWEGNVGPAGDLPNRHFTLTNTVQTLPLVYWNNIASASSSFLVGFQVDMSVEDAFGVFNPGDTVFVNGDWDWSGYAMQLTPVGSSDLYTGAVLVAFSPGTTVSYKYTIDGGLIWENNGVGPGGAQNHEFLLNTATNLSVDHFNNYSDLGPVTISGPVGQTALSWASGTNVNNRIRLQSTTNLLSGWSDVSGAAGQSAITNDFGAGKVFFRLVAP
jgi:hypothetical protein